jgi:hypothetical protein
LPRVRTTFPVLIAATCLFVAACGDDDADEDPTVAETTAVEDAASLSEGSDSQGPNGSGGSGQGAGVEAPAPEQVVELVLTTTNPEDGCVPPHVTESYVRSSYGSASGCAQALGEGGPVAESVKVEPVDDSGDSAETVAVARGGVYDGEGIEVQLIRQGDAWSVDAIEVDVPAGP